MRIANLLSHFISLIFLMLFMWIGAAYVSQNIQYSCAKQFFNSAIVKMENNDLKEDIINQCKEKAERKGYHLTVDTVQENSHIDARVILEFDYLYPVIQVSRHYTIEGYAR